MSVMTINSVTLAQQMQAKRDADAAAAVAAAAQQNDVDVVDDGGRGGAATPAPARSSPSGDLFGAENQLDSVDKCFVDGRSRLDLSGLQDRLSVASIHSPTDYIALPTVRLSAVPFVVVLVSK